MLCKNNYVVFHSFKGSDASWKNDEEPPQEVNTVHVGISFGGILYNFSLQENKAFYFYVRRSD